MIGREPKAGGRMGEMEGERRREERGRWGEGVRRMRDERELGEIMLVVKV